MRSGYGNLLEVLNGISAIPITPFNADGAVDEETLVKVVARITSAGIELVVACGNTSEYSSLTATEIELVTAVTIEAAGSVATIVGVGGDVATAVRTITRSVALGATGVMIHAPSDPYVSEVGLIDYYAALAGATDAGVVLYVRGRDLSPRVLERVVGFENVVAIKYARRDLMGFSRLVDRFADVIVPVCGLAESWAPFFWLAGGRGFTSGLANVAPELSVMLLKALQAGDYVAACRVWHRIKPFENLRERGSDALNVAAVKEAMVVRGYLQNAAVRAPMSALSSEEHRELVHIINDWETPGE